MYLTTIQSLPALILKTAKQYNNNNNNNESIHKEQNRVRKYHPKCAHTHGHQHTVHEYTNTQSTNNINIMN